MNAEKRAKELVDKYNIVTTNLDCVSVAHAKQCAIICCDEILSLAYALHDFTETQFIKTDYWQQVKQALENIK